MFFYVSYNMIVIGKGIVGLFLIFFLFIEIFICCFNFLRVLFVGEFSIFLFIN